MATAESAFADYTEAHPAAAKAFGKSLGLPLDDPARMAAVVPVVRITLTTGCGSLTSADARVMIAFADSSGAVVIPFGQLDDILDEAMRVREEEAEFIESIRTEDPTTGRLGDVQ